MSSRQYRLIGREIAVPFLYAAGVLSLLGLWLVPETAAHLGLEDGIVETASALSFLIASVSLAVYAYRFFPKNKQLSLLLVLMALLFFIFAGEEISWGQRLLGVESSEFMKQYNWQSEMNLHNLQTDLFNITFHYGALLFLIIFPLFRGNLVRFSEKLSLQAFRFIITPSWIVLPSFIFIGMIDPRFIYSVEKPWAAVCYLSALGIGLVLMAFIAIKAVRLRDKQTIRLLALSFSAILFGLYVSYLQAVDRNPNSISEYKELFVALGLCIFALSWSDRVGPDDEKAYL